MESVELVSLIEVSRVGGIVTTIPGPILLKLGLVEFKQYANC